MWPDKDSKYEYKIAIGKPKFLEMSPKRKPKIREALEQEIIQSEKTISGRLVELNVTKKHSCQIETPEGKFFCKYRPDVEDIIKINTGNFVSVSGKMKDSRTIFLESEMGNKKN